ncbi:cGMP-dependent 3',5'-cyclic phosphodiesterase-like isoform X2 [Tubulanus polymorphus]
MNDLAAEERIQDAILRLSGVVTLDELRSAIKDAIKLALPEVTEVVLYLLNPATHELVSSDGLTHTLPKDGVLADVLKKRQLELYEGIDASDPLSGLFKTSTGSLNPSKTVVCAPVIEKENDRVIAVILSICSHLNDADRRHLEFVQKQLAVTYRRISSVASSTHGRRSVRSNADAILKLCGELYDQDAASLQLKVIKYLQNATDAQCAFLLLRSQDDTLFCQVMGDQVFPDEIWFPNSKNLVTNTDFLSHEQLDEDQRNFLEKRLNFAITSFLSVPVISKGTKEIVAVACVVNKRAATRFNSDDIAAIQECFEYTATVLTSTLAFQKEQKLKNQTTALLKVAKNLFRQLDDLTVLLREIMQEARNLTNAERCSVFLVEKETEELVAKVFDGIAADDKEELTSEIRLPLSQGIAGHVASTGDILNIKDAYSHPLFYKGIDESTGFRTRNILCFPIKDENGVVIGVAQLCNKKIGEHFTVFDVEIAKAFSVYCCISIVHSILYQKVHETQLRSRLASELMSYHMKVSGDEMLEYLHVDIPTPESIIHNMSALDCLPRHIVEKDTLWATLSMFDDLGFINRFRIKRDTLVRFILLVRKGYRDNPYHNWTHAFSVAHFCYLAIKNFHLSEYLEDIEMFSLFVACLCHDIDHRGTNNSYQVESKSVLANLYSSDGSVLERHHFTQTVSLLNLEGCNVFETVSDREYAKILDLLKDIILATDLANHLRIIKDLQAMAKSGYEKKSARCHKLLLCLLMTCCDLSDQTKTWQNSKTVAECVYKEFFTQGDLEKAMGKKPLDMMDRDRACIPDLQIGFLDHIVIPVITILSDLFPVGKVLLDNVRSHKTMWLRVSNKMKTGQLTSNTSMDIFEMDLEAASESWEHKNANGSKNS